MYVVHQHDGIRFYEDDASIYLYSLQYAKSCLHLVTLQLIETIVTCRSYRRGFNIEIG
jgi:hypothetical protein